MWTWAGLEMKKLMLELECTKISHPEVGEGDDSTQLVGNVKRSD